THMTTRATEDEDLEIDDGRGRDLTEMVFRTCTRRACDTSSYSEGIFALSCDSRTEVTRWRGPPSWRGRKAGRGSAGPRAHVRLDLLRPRRPPLGGHLGGSEGRRERQGRKEKPT